MIAVLEGLVLGATVGAVFGLFRLVPPAPATAAGVAGVVGIWAGWVIVGTVIGRMSS